MEFVPEVITACLFLHNLCIATGDILEPEPVEEEDGGDGDGGEGHEPVQRTLRNRLAAAVSAPRDRVNPNPNPVNTGSFVCSVSEKCSNSCCYCFFQPCCK